MDFINPESAEKYVEKGWDEEKQMYYLVYFNKEEKDPPLLFQKPQSHLSN
jgi:hypothetical protein